MPLIMLLCFAARRRRLTSTTINTVPNKNKIAPMTDNANENLRIALLFVPLLLLLLPSMLVSNSTPVTESYKYTLRSVNVFAGVCVVRVVVVVCVGDQTCHASFMLFHQLVFTGSTIIGKRQSAPLNEPRDGGSVATGKLTMPKSAFSVATALNGHCNLVRKAGWRGGGNFAEGRRQPADSGDTRKGP
jgi:hypothetical protein